MASPVHHSGAHAGPVHEDGGDLEGVRPRLHLVGDLHVVEAAPERDEALDAVAAPDADDGLVGAEAPDVDAHAVVERVAVLVGGGVAAVRVCGGGLLLVAGDGAVDVVARREGVFERVGELSEDGRDVERGVVAPVAAVVLDVVGGDEAGDADALAAEVGGSRRRRW